WTYKLEEAARQGALGALLVHTTESATYPWEVVRGSWSVEQFMLDRARPQSLAFAGWVQHDVAQRALAQVGLDLDALTRAAGRGAGPGRGRAGPPPHRPLHRDDGRRERPARQRGVRAGAAVSARANRSRAEPRRHERAGRDARYRRARH